MGQYRPNHEVATRLIARGHRGSNANFKDPKNVSVFSIRYVGSVAIPAERSDTQLALFFLCRPTTHSGN